MNVEIKTRLVDQIKEIRTIGDNFPVYRDAEVKIKRVNPNEVYPISKYVVEGNLEKIMSIRKELEARGFNIFDLDDILEYDGGAISPPLVENDGEVDCIVDGLHRLFLARIEGRDVKVIYVTGADSSHPLIGKPISWDRVVRRQDLPIDPKERRDLREGIEDTSECLRRNYRDLSILGSKGRRATRGQEN